MSANHVVTCYRGKNRLLFKNVARLYLPPGSIIADVTYGRGGFWKDIDIAGNGYTLLASDVVPLPGLTTVCDFRSLPYKDQSVDAVVLDPPYLYVGGWKTMTMKLGGYRNQERAAGGISGVAAVNEMYREALDEAWRVVREGGLVFVKCQDQVMSGRQEWQHIMVHNQMADIGFLNQDLFILTLSNHPMMRHRAEKQQHARRNHSYLLVGKRPSSRRSTRTNTGSSEIAGSGRPE